VPTGDSIRTEDDPVKEKTDVEGEIADAKVADRIVAVRGLLEQVAWCLASSRSC
jgi:hypothetical protein